MKSLFKLVPLAMILVLPFTVCAQDSNSSVSIIISYVDKNGAKHREHLEYTGEEAENFDVEAYKAELEEKGYKIQTIDVSKNVNQTTKNSDSKGKVMIMKHGAHDDIDIEKEVKVRVDGDDIYINGEKVDAEDMQKDGHMVIEMITDEDGTEQKKVMIMKEGAEMEGEMMKWVGDDGNTFMFKSDDDQPRLGVMVDDAKEVNGAEVLEVVADSPAAAAGVMAGDVITKVDGQGVYGSNSLIEALGTLEAGQAIKITVMRNGQPTVLDAKITNGSGGAKKVIKKRLKVIKEEKE